MREHDGSDGIAAGHRRKDVAAMLAAGLLRHCRMAKMAVAPSPAESSELQRNCLELSGGRGPVCPPVRAANTSVTLLVSTTASRMWQSLSISTEARDTSLKSSWKSHSRLRSWRVRRC